MLRNSTIRSQLASKTYQSALLRPRIPVITADLRKQPQLTMDNIKANLNLKKSIDKRARKNILKEAEQQFIQYLCPKIPNWVSPDILTYTGIAGSVVVLLGLCLAIFYSKFYLLLSVLGFFIHWFGDSLDGRIAYYRNTPRKWHGWALDINADWISICIIGFGFYLYFPSYKVLAFLFVVSYGGSMILSLLQYKLSDKYIIDKAYLGPTELRILICLALIVEIFVPYTLLVFASLGSIVLLLLNLFETNNVLKEGDKRDLSEKRLKRKVILRVAQ